MRLRYLATGGYVAVFGALLIALLHALGLSGLGAAVLASLAVVPVGYTAQRLFVFRATSPWLVGLGAYAGLAALNAPVGWGVVFVLVDVMGQPAFLAALAAMGLASAANYLVLSKLVFRP